MLLAIDIGNTHVALGLFNGSQLVHHWRLGTNTHYTSDEVAALVRSLFELSDVDRSEVRRAIISCVVPPLLPIFERTCTKLIQSPPLVVGSGIRSGMSIRVDNPREVGADRIANSVAAYQLLGGPAISIDFGTATSFDCISEDGEFIGGAIFPAYCSPSMP